ncbi:PAS domain S-box protein [Methanofollis aquaemaris]|uniref:PAS domain S-box protein n=1 Tax=Methanofollis aquaemaris TaxID=126734 RepID=A0A8A3S7Y6_9EURY|nr:PAS domain S-box protein [Methanofollis aquaemaris]QSZ67800.1 PAS domain S-box protein [Methanofollis aquaemaris]
MSETLEHQIADAEITDRILGILRFRKKGATISEISRETHLNRNSVAKYLEVLLASGQVEMKRIGKAKAYSLSRRVPVSVLIDTISEYIVILDEHTRILEINEPYLSFCGRGKDELVGCPLFAAALPGLTDDLAPLVKEALAGDPFAEEVCLERDGLARHFRVNFVPTVLASGEDGLMILMADTTEKTNVEAGLRESEKFYRTVFNNINAAVFLLDVEEGSRPGSFIAANDHACDFFDSPRDELIGTAFARFTLPECPRVGEDSVFLAFGQGEYANAEMALANRRGERMVVRIRSHSFLYDDSPVILSVVRDITEERKKEEQDRKYVISLEYLTGTAAEFSCFPPDRDIYDYIADEICGLVPDAIVAVNAPLEDGSGWVNRAFRGWERHRQNFDAVMGGSPEGRPVTMNGKQMRFFKSGIFFHHRVTDDDISLADEVKQNCMMLAEHLGYGEYYIKGLVADSVLYGMVILSLPIGKMLADQMTVEAFIDQAAAALRRRQAERRLEEANEELRFALSDHESDLRVLQKALGDQRYEREQTEKAIRDLADLALRCISLGNMAVVGLSRGGDVIHISPAMSSVIGCSVEDAVGRHWYSSFVPASVREKAMELHRLLLAGVIGTGETVCPLLTGDGEERTMVWAVRRVAGGQDDGLAVLWFGEEPPGKKVMALSFPG